MITIKQIKEPSEITHATESILRDLPTWFGQEDSLVEYVKNTSKYPFYLALVNGEVSGFLSLDLNNGITAEIYVMGVYSRFHGQGVGSALVQYVKNILREKKFTYLLVKTLGPSSSDLSYKKTRNFYESVGFQPVQEILEIWGKDNPCLVMIQSLDV